MNEKNKSTHISLQLYPNDCQYVTLPNHKFPPKKGWKKRNLNEIRSVIPGSVTELFVKEGGMVKKGTPLLKYEAMKMENIVCAPADGRISKVCVEVGASFPKGILMISWE